MYSISFNIYIQYLYCILHNIYAVHRFYVLVSGFPKVISVHRQTSQQISTCKVSKYVSLMFLDEKDKYQSHGIGMDKWEKGRNSGHNFQHEASRLSPRVILSGLGAGDL